MSFEPGFFCRFFLPLIVAMAGVQALAQDQEGCSGPFKLCHEKFALCMAAVCTPIPKYDKATGKAVASDQALCECVVFEPGSPSLGLTDCEQRRPSGDREQFIVSTYSWETFGNELMTCPPNTPRTDCFNKPCMVDPNDPKRAWCTCEIDSKESDPFMTLGGDCDRGNCLTKLFQGGTPEQVKELNEAFAACTQRKLPEPYLCESRDP